MNLLPISVICASHKGIDKLPKLIASIEKNLLLPREIIIVHTSKNDLNKINKKKFKKLNILTKISKIKNQVYQRQLALKMSTQPIISQLDDDLIVSKDYFEKMYSHFKKKNQKKIVSAQIHIEGGRNIQSYRWNYHYYNNFFFRLTLLLLNGFQPIKHMSILKSGRVCPLLPKKYLNRKSVIKNLEWTCSTICYNKNALKYSYMLKPKLNSKAFFEDVFFTHSLMKKGYQLCIDPMAKAHHPFFLPTDLNVHLKTLRSQFELVKTFKKSYFFFLLDVIIFTIYFVVKKKF